MKTGPWKNGAPDRERGGVEKSGTSIMAHDSCRPSSFGPGVGCPRIWQMHIVFFLFRSHNCYSLLSMIAQCYGIK